MADETRCYFCQLLIIRCFLETEQYYSQIFSHKWKLKPRYTHYDNSRRHEEPRLGVVYLVRPHLTSAVYAVAY